MDIPADIIKQESIVYIENEIDGDILTNIKTESDEDNMQTKTLKQELESPVNTENDSDEDMSTKKIKIERDQAIENQINKILGTTLEEESDMYETNIKIEKVESDVEDEMNRDYKVDVNSLSNIKTEEIMLKSESDERETGAHWKNYIITKNDKNAIREHRCYLCDYVTNQKSNLVRHTKAKHNKNSIKKVCNLCDYSTHRKDHLAQHVLRKHDTNSKKHGCNICDYCTHQKSHLKYHMLIKHNNNLDKKHGCDICSFSSHRKRDLKYHMLSKHDKNSIKEHGCDLCDYRTHRKDYLKLHVLAKHNNNSIKEHGCDFCDYSTHMKRTLQRHIMNKHGERLNLLLLDSQEERVFFYL